MKKILVLFVGGMLVLLFTGVLGTGSVSAKNDTLRLKVFIHEPNHGKPIPPTTCTATTDDQVDDWLYAGWQMPTGGMTYQINLTTKPTNLTEAQINSAIASSFATWAVADSDQIFNPSSSTLVRGAKYDGINAVLFKNITDRH